MAYSFRRTVAAAILALVAVLFLSGARPTSAALTPAQETATLSFLNAFAESLPALQLVWTTSDWCSWTYLDCTNETNITLIIDKADLAGSLPELADTVTGANVALHTIALTNMNITGSFPVSWSALTALRVVDLSNTSLFGTVPLEWNAIASLTSVYLANSGACGNLPNWTNAALRNIDLSSNYLRGTLPAVWSSMTRLSSLNISNNDLCGCLPPSWVSDVLTYAAMRALGYVAHPTACRTSARCSAAQECSREKADYGDAAAAPARAVLAAVMVLVMAVASASAF